MGPGTLTRSPASANPNTLTTATGRFFGIPIHFTGFEVQREHTLHEASRGDPVVIGECGVAAGRGNGLSGERDGTRHGE